MWNFNSIIDVGCGKGSLTHLLKRNNNKVFGIDVPSTAIKRAKVRYPNIDFFKIDVNSDLWFYNFLKKNRYSRGVAFYFLQKIYHLLR